MFNRIKAGVGAVVAILGAFGLESCNMANNNECLCQIPPTEYGALPHHYSDYCKQNNEIEFYEDLCYSSIDTFAYVQKLDRDPTVSDITDNDEHHDKSDAISMMNLFKERISFAEKTCCKSLKPKEMDNDEHYCDHKQLKGQSSGLGCETYRGCIQDVISHKDGKNYHLCQTDDTKNDNKLNAQDDAATESASDQPHENE